MRFISHFNSLLLGVILGMVLLALVHGSPLGGNQQVRASQITVAYVRYEPRLEETKTWQVSLRVPGIASFQLWGMTHAQRL